MDNEIISFDIAKINRGKEKICKCKFPHYEIDTTNRIVMCTDCGAIIDPFDAMVSLAERYDDLERCQREMLKRYEFYKRNANIEFKRMIKNKTFRTMDEQYKEGLLPICPECLNPFDPMEINRWTHK